MLAPVDWNLKNGGVANATVARLDGSRRLGTIVDDVVATRR